MKYVSVLAAAAIAATGWTAMVQAQSSTKVVPAEFPPSSFSGRQYVDSQGCVFIRAGIDSNVTWVPRMTRGRQQVCGFQPSLSSTALAATVAPRATAAEPEQTVAAAPAPAPATVPARTTTRVVAAPAPAPAPQPSYRTAPKPAVAPATPKPIAPVVASVAPSPADIPSVCSNRSALSQQYLVSRRGDVRCGPQSEPHFTVKDGPPSPDATYYRHASPSTTSPHQRIAPKHVYEDQLASTAGIYVPEGYQPVWDDDRLNPYRAHQTFAGKEQMDQIWTRRTPRELKPGVIAGSYVSYAAGGVPDDAVAPEVSRAAPLTSAPTLAADTSPASHRYVQIGAFTDPAQARRTAQKLANSGLPAKIGPHSQGGKSYTLVVVGPFSTQGSLDQGFAQVRGMGYTSANLRR